ncbi:acintoc3 [Mayetiola barley midge adintovirus]|uniref:acintoc3 n=1 Tax=Mayetiola barley midge adintovirus TaxID=2609858 RepID=UPI002481DC8D|nr:acintoc3 [Mayetiola barley midge adintovirus]DAC81323.1 TPA_asm: acintoc3 [Mayetiola barley midge adintovirus]
MKSEIMSAKAKQLKSLVKTRQIIAKKFQKLQSDKVKQTRKLGEKYAPITDSLKKLIDLQKGTNDSDDSDDSDGDDPMNNGGVDLNNNEQNGYENANITGNEREHDNNDWGFFNDVTNDGSGAFELLDEAGAETETDTEIDINAKAEKESGKRNKNKDSNSKQRNKIIALKKPKTKKQKKQSNLNYSRGIRQDTIEKRKSNQAIKNEVDSDSFSDEFEDNDELSDNASIGSDNGIDSDTIAQIRNDNKRLKRKSMVDIVAKTVTPSTKLEKKKVELKYLSGYRRHAFNKSKAKQQKQMKKIQEQLENESKKMQSSSGKSNRTKHNRFRNSKKKLILSPEDFDQYGIFKGLNKSKRRKIETSRKKYKSVKHNNAHDLEDDDDDMMNMMLKMKNSPLKHQK